MIEKVSQNQFRAANRFGLGTSTADLRAMGGDPLEWLLRQLKSPPTSGPKVPASATSIATNGASLRVVGKRSVTQTPTPIGLPLWKTNSVIFAGAHGACSCSNPNSDSTTR